MRIHAFHNLYQHRLLRSTKPFNARGAKVKRCPFCYIEQHYCLCDYQPDISTNIAVLLLVSENEVFKPSNTGHLIADVIKECYVYQWNRTEPAREMLSLLENEHYQPIIVFPDTYLDDKARLMTDLCSMRSSQITTDVTEKPQTNIKTNEVGHHVKKPLFIFLDGSWREARRIFRKSPYLDHLPVFSISPQTMSQYQMRKSENETHLSTAEVAALVFENIGESLAAVTLKQWFNIFKESYLLSKTRMKQDKTRPLLQQYKKICLHD